MRSGQIKMGETIAILVIFFFLLMFGFSFYAAVQQHYFREQAEKNLQLKALQITQKAAYLPELQCSHNNIQEENCIDIIKLTAAAPIISLNNAAYFNLLGYSSIYVKEIYPGDMEWDLYDFTRPENTGQISTQFPTSLYDPRTNTYSFGVLYVDVYR